ncbi:MAG TPA: FUSC family protein [Solirubrobacteraceae bacterium]|jgi:hypothetical protein
MSTGKLTSALARRDPGLQATRRAARAAIFAPLLLWFGKGPLDDPTLGTFAALASLGMLVFANFTGPMRERLRAQVLLALTSAGLLCLGTLTSNTTWLATTAAALVVFVVLFAGVFSSLLASATTVLVISFVLPATIAAPPGTLSDRLLGWLLAGAISVLAIRFLWPAPTAEPLRIRAGQACHRFAAQLDAEAGCFTAGFAGDSLGDLQAIRLESATSAMELRNAFYATPYRPGGLSTSSRALVRATDALIWLDRVFARVPLDETTTTKAANSGAVCALTIVAAELLEHCADLLLAGEGDLAHLDEDLERLHNARQRMEAALTTATATEATTPADDTARRSADDTALNLVSSLQPSFRAQEISFVVAHVAANVHLGVAARERGWWSHLLGGEPRQPGQAGGAAHGSALSSVAQRARAHLTPGSVWLHNSLRGAIALALAVMVAKLSNVQHGFWLVFGTLAVLRTDAFSTGQDALKGLSGTVVGIALGGGLVALLGSESTLAWLVLVPAVALIALGPVLFNFAIGQVGFTTTLLLLNNIVTPAGWSAGLVRIEDVAIGCAVALVAGTMFWPRGAGRALGHALAAGYESGGRYLQATVAYGVGRCDAHAPQTPRPQDEPLAASVAGRRLDDAFRNYVAERGTKRLPLADVAALVGGVSLLRLTADAMMDVWERDEDEHDSDSDSGNNNRDDNSGDRATASEQLNGTAREVGDWYAQAATALNGEGQLPAPASPEADTVTRDGARFIEAIRDLADHDGAALATAVKMIWTADHVDAARRLQSEIATPSQKVAGRWR